jgi:TATA-box binding protein (TBP) (component of TFIID and TFIIIB)
MFEKLKTSTSTIVGICNCTFDIDLIFQKIEVEGNIVKVKCNNKEKTKELQRVCKTFYNQITIHFDNNMNIKLFNNGKFQISGVKDMEDSLAKLELFLSHIETIYGDCEIEPVKYNSVYTYKNKILTPHLDGYRCENLIKGEKILINNKICEPFDLVDGDVLIEKTHTNKVKTLYNCFGKKIGIVSYNMLRKNKNLCIKNAVYTKTTQNTFDILKSEKYRVKIGELELVLEDYQHIELASNIKLYFRCCSQKPDITQYKIANTNYNIKLKIQKNCYFDRVLFCSYLKEMNINYVFEQSKYPGVKFQLSNTKITIFRTGSILFSKGDESVDIQDVLTQLEKLFEGKNFIKTKMEITNEENDITIWDLM